MRMSPLTSSDRAQPTSQLKVERPSDWHPAKLSDRKLSQLRRKLVKVQRLGDAFATVGFSPQAEVRLQENPEESPK